MKNYFFNHPRLAHILYEILQIMGLPLLWGIPLSVALTLVVLVHPLYWLILLYIPLSYYGFNKACALPPYFTKGWLCPHCPPFPLKVYPRTIHWQSLRCKECGHKLNRWENGEPHLYDFLYECELHPKLRERLNVPAKIYDIEDLWDSRITLEVEEHNAVGQRPHQHINYSIT